MTEVFLYPSIPCISIYSGLLLGIIFIIGTLAFLEPILKFLGTTESIMPYAIKYARIFIAASIFNIFNVMMNNIITSEGAAKISMFAMLSGALLNMILDPIFINVLNMGVTGAAIASAIGQALSTVVFLSYQRVFAELLPTERHQKLNRWWKDTLDFYFWIKTICLW